MVSVFRCAITVDLLAVREKRSPREAGWEFQDYVEYKEIGAKQIIPKNCALGFKFIAMIKQRQTSGLPC